MREDFSPSTHGALPPQLAPEISLKQEETAGLQRGLVNMQNVGLGL